MTSCRVRGPPHRWCFHRVPPATTHDVCSSRQVVTIHRLVHWHTFSNVDLCFASLLLGGHCHVLVSLKVALCRLISTRLLDLTSLFNRVDSQVLRDCFFKRKKLTRTPHLIERRQHTTKLEKVTSEANSELLVNIFKKNLDF